jgi:hypothetical protein
MTEFKVRAALRAQLETVVADSLLARENESYAPADGTPWVRETLLPGTPERSEAGVNGRFTQYGVYQVDVFAPEGQGVGVAESVAGVIATAFVPGNGYDDGDGGPTVWIRRTYIEGASQTGTWYQVPVTIDWKVKV